MTMGTRIVVMNAGEVQQVDAPQTLYDYPNNTFVATFIGSPQMNMIEGELAGPDGAMVFQAEGVAINLPADLSKAAKEANAGRVVLGIRPEHMEPITTGDQNGANVVKATVEVVEHMGAELYVYLQAGRENNLTARFSAEHSFAPGNNIGVEFDTSHLHLFNGETGNAIAHGSAYPA
jgi:multiple sugar transport system ATP-binding protein